LGFTEGFQRASRDFDFTYLAVDFQSFGNQIRLPGSFSPSLGVANVVARERTAFCNFTSLRHNVS